MDEVDRSILRLLRENGRATNEEIGRRIGLTESAVRRRIDRLHEAGTIVRFTIDTVPLGAEGLVLIRCRPSSTARLSRQLRSLSRQIFEMSGGYDIAALVERSTMEDLNRVLDRIRALAGIESTTTLIPLTQRFPAGRPSARPRPARSHPRRASSRARR